MKQIIIFWPKSYEIKILSFIQTSYFTILVDGWFWPIPKSVKIPMMKRPNKSEPIEVMTQKNFFKMGIWPERIKKNGQREKKTMKR